MKQKSGTRRLSVFEADAERKRLEAEVRAAAEKEKAEDAEREAVRTGSKPRAHKRHPPQEGDQEVCRE